MAQGDYEMYGYMVEDYDTADFDEDVEESLQAARERVSLETESDSDDNEGTQRVDTTAAEARRGKDIQGIPWSILQFTREKYREQRLQQYKNYLNLMEPQSHEELDKECKVFKKGGKFYEFRHNTRSVKSTYVHFQLRNLVWATSKHDVYLMHNSKVMHWSPMSRKSTEVLNVSGPVASVSGAQRNLWSYHNQGSGAVGSVNGAQRNLWSYHNQGLGPVQISTMCVKRNLLVAGGFQGEMVCKNLSRPGIAHCAKITHDENAITNAIEIYDHASGGTRLMTSNNDSVVRVFDCESFQILSKFEYKWPVNHTSVSPDGRMVIVVGDHTDGLLAESQSGKVIATLAGHEDFSFASAWHPDGNIFATGNQDMTCRLWDSRNLCTALTVLKGRIGAIRSIRFSSDGRFMAMAEPADFVHIFDTKQDYSQCQEIDIFGEVAGISFSPDTEALFIGVADRTYGSLLEFNRSHADMYLDSYF